MALHGTIQVNGKSIAAWEARRVDPPGRPGTFAVDAVCTYHWTYFDLQSDTQLRGTVSHRYCEGAHKLIGRIMLALG